MARRVARFQIGAEFTIGPPLLTKLNADEEFATCPTMVLRDIQHASAFARVAIL